MIPHVPKITIREVAEETGKSWESVAKEKMKTDMLILGIVIIIGLILSFLL